MPATTLAASTLTGTATWTGELVGYTDAGTAVEGAAGITVDIAPMTGTAAFTDIRAGAASWGPDLSTAIGVSGNYIAATQGGPWVGFDAQFRGSGHEAATGVLRWKDTATGNLTGACGAIREGCSMNDPGGADRPRRVQHHHLRQGSRNDGTAEKVISAYRHVGRVCRVLQDRHREQ